LFGITGVTGLKGCIGPTGAIATGPTGARGKSLYGSGTVSLGLVGAGRDNPLQIFYTSTTQQVEGIPHALTQGNPISFSISQVTTQSIADCDVILTSFVTSNVYATLWDVTCTVAISDSLSGGPPKVTISDTPNFFTVNWVAMLMPM
jgi:hypothetical protein